MAAVAFVILAFDIGTGIARGLYLGNSETLLSLLGIVIVGFQVSRT